MSTLEEELLAQAKTLGFALAGIAPAEPADDFAWYLSWLENGYAGEMNYLHNQAEARRHPSGVYPQVCSVLMVAMSYGPTNLEPREQKANTGRIARYASGADYHVVVRERLKELLGWLRQRQPNCWGRIAVDTAPLLERGFARRAGLGWVGKNTMLIHPMWGSTFVLGAVLLNLELSPSKSFDSFHCGTCRACLDACPTLAFPQPGVLDARRCISYHNIERKGPLEENWQIAIENWLFGCDICQDVCPWNQKASRRNRLPLAQNPLSASEDMLALDACWLLGLDEEAFRKAFRDTALHPRPGRAVILRNAALVLGNTGDADALEALTKACQDANQLVSQAANWAVTQIWQRLERTDNEGGE